MLRIFYRTNYDFIRWWKVALAFTATAIVLGILSFALRPLNLNIEFIGGTMVHVKFTGTPPTSAEIRSALEDGGVGNAQIQPFDTDRDFTIRATEVSQVQQQEAGAETIANQIQSALTERFGADGFTVERTDAVGPRVGGELARGALMAVLLSMVIVLLYLAWRFEWRFGLAAVIATMHDVVATMALIKLMNLEISLPVVAGILTVLGYSLNNTIIIFDRVRENLRKKRKESLYDTLNRSVNETLPRSVMTHGTTAAATLALLLFAGEVLRPFAWVMTFGIVLGTISSVIIASPTLLYIERRWPREVGDRGGIGARIPRQTL